MVHFDTPYNLRYILVGIQATEKINVPGPYKCAVSPKNILIYQITALFPGASVYR
jgi:hypothetical protein